MIFVKLLKRIYPLLLLLLSSQITSQETIIPFAQGGWVVV
jgi:hypothetical protein